jgi:hypothetical protein
MKYHLYLIPPERIPEGEKYYLITPSYCLLYTAAVLTNGVEEITEVSKLPALAKNWLGQCIDDVRREVLTERQDEVLRSAERFRDTFQKELDRERREIRKAGKRRKWRKGGQNEQ